MKNNKALHVWYIDTIDAKIASSIAYEYTSEYLSNINIYKFHKYNNDNEININSVRDNDFLIFIGLNIFSNRKLLKIVSSLGNNDKHQILIIDNNNSLSNTKIDNMNYKNIDYIGNESYSLSLSLYNFLKNKLISDNRISKLENRESEIINIINNNYRSKKDSFNHDKEENFMYGIHTENFTAKNFFRNIYGSHRMSFPLSIFKLSSYTSDIEHEYINTIAKRGKEVKNLINNKLVNEILKCKNMFVINDETNNHLYKGVAYNTSLPISNFMNINDDNIDIICTYYKDNDIWKYTMVSKHSRAYINIKYYSDILSIYNESIISEDYFINDINGCNFITDKCIFDLGNQINFRRPIFIFFNANKIKVTYSFIDDIE